MRWVTGEKNLLKAFFKRPSAEFTTRELEKEARLSHERVFTYLQDFVSNSFVTLKKVGNSNIFKANLDNEKLLKFFELMEVEKKHAFYAKKPAYSKRFAEFIEDLNINGNLLMLILFGSAARKEEQPSSDLDALLVIPNSASKTKIENNVIKAIKKYSMTHGKQLNVLTVKLQTFEKGFEQGKSFYANLWRDRVVIHGESNFWNTLSKKREAEWLS